MEEELNLLDPKVRINILADIKSEDNHNRKRDQQKRHDVYHGQQDIYIIERLRREFAEKTVQEMRKILSINLAKRMIDEKSSVYNRDPKRTFSTRSGSELSDEQIDLLNSVYENLPINQTLKKSNVKLNLHDQGTLMVVPDMKGGFKVRSISPVHYDVVPSVSDPEKAHAYILNVWDKDIHGTVRSGNSDPQLSRYKGNDRNNQTVADDDDRKALFERYIVWTKDVHFVMDGRGTIIGEETVNPIGILPFIDVAPEDKDFQFFVRRGSQEVDFNLDFGMILSDFSNIIKLQGHGQAVIASEKIPENMIIGPNHVLHLKLDPKRPELTPRFEFITPNANLDGIQNFLESLLNLHLTSDGQDPALISANGQQNKFNSGLDRLLSMITKFEANRDDFALFRRVEDEYLQIIYRWLNVFQPVTGESELRPEFKGPVIPDDIQVDVEYMEPEAIQTKEEKMDSLDKARDGGYKSRIDVIMEMNGVDRDKAIEMAEQIDEDEKLYGGGGFLPTDMTDDNQQSIDTPEATEDDLRGAVDSIGGDSETISEVSLNGAQVTAMVGVIDKVANGQLPRETAIQIISTAFPITPEQASRIMGDVGRGFVPESDDEGE